MMSCEASGAVMLYAFMSICFCVKIGCRLTGVGDTQHGAGWKGLE